MNSRVLLIHPPVSKPCEPPGGIAKLCGALHGHRIGFDVIDANLEGLFSLTRRPPRAIDTWTRRAFRHLEPHLALLRGWEGYSEHDRYRRAVLDVNHLVEMSGDPRKMRVGLANCEHRGLSPVRSRDLLQVAERPEESPFYGYFEERIRHAVETQQPSVVGFSLNTLAQAFSTFALMGFLKKENSRLELVLGGGLITSWMRQPHWKNPFGGLVDHLVAGPGEEALLSLLGAKGEPPYLPRYEALPVEQYVAPGFILPYSSSMGCYWNQCSFCPEKAEANPYVSPVPRKAIDELHQLVNHYRPVLIHLLDNAVPPSLMKALSEDPPGAPWYGFSRITDPLKDIEFCLALRRSGCVMLELGVESGDQAVLDHLHKGIRLEDASLALRTLKRAGIGTYVYLLFGTPREGIEEARKTLAFVVEHCDQIDFLNLALFNLPLYSPETPSVETRSFYDGDLALYTDFVHPRGWDRKSIRQFLDKEFRRHPAIAPILRRDPPIFTSNHAPLWMMARSRHQKPMR
jgi:radical SAM superfamily enzyme YgiQ (UPF0313 family)